MKTVVIRWSYPMDIHNIFFDERVDGIGFYYISRKIKKAHSWEYKESLLYIGKTCDSFYHRLASHEKNWLHEYRGKKLVRLGTIVSPHRCNEIQLQELIHDVESTLIFEMRDYLIQNTMCLNSYTPYNLYKIRNTGRKGMLPSEINMKNHVVEESAFF